MDTPDSPGAYQKVSVDEAKRLMDTGDVTIVDVRWPDEYAQSHLPGAILVPFDTIGLTQPKELPDLDAPLLVYCSAGVRSAMAAESLMNLGYRHIYDMTGGFDTWRYETEV